MQLDPLVKPRSIAIVGATDRAGPARSVIESLGAIGFTGPIYPVNPKYQTVRNLERAAMSAGAGPLRTFLWVTLPVLRPGILVGALFAFLHSFNEAVVAIFIAGRDAATLPKRMFESIRLESDPVIAVVSTLLTGAVLLGVLVSLLFRQRPVQRLVNEA